MRIVVIGPTYPYRGGIAHHTTLLVRALRAMGHELLFLSFKRQYPRWLYGRDDRDPGETAIREPAEYLLDSMNPLTWWATARRAAAFGPNLVIIPWWVPFWFPQWGYMSRVIRQRLPKTRLIFICHNVLPHEESNFDRLALRVALGRGDGYVVHARSQMELLGQFWPAAEVLHTPMPTYAPLLTPIVTPEDPQLDRLPVDRPLLLFCGLVRPYKGLDILLQALPRVLSRLPVHLAIVGEFWEDRHRYERLLGELGLVAHVSLRDEYVPDPILSAYLRRASAVVLPYREATQSAMVQAALAAGTPVIATRVGGLPEAIEDGVNGFLVPPEDPLALAEAIVRFLDEGFDLEMGRGLQEGEIGYSWQNFAADLISFARGLELATEAGDSPDDISREPPSKEKGGDSIPK